MTTTETCRYRNDIVPSVSGRAELVTPNEVSTDAARCGHCK